MRSIGSWHYAYPQICVTLDNWRDVDVTLRFEILVYSEIGEYDLFRM